MAQAWGDLRSDYAAARDSRFRRRRTGVSAMGSGADFHYRSEGAYLRMVEYARAMDRDDCIVGQTVDRAVTNVVQDGFTLDARSGDDKLDKDLAARWKEWAEDADLCDLAGEQTFPEMESQLFRQSLVDGDVVALATKEGPLELIEGHRLRKPRNTKRNVVHGVLLDEHRKRLEYWLTKDDIEPGRAVQRVNQIKAYPTRDVLGHRQVFHVYTSKRISQTRGVTAFAPIFDLLGMHEDINFAKLVQMQLVSCYAIFRKRDSDFQGGAVQPTGEQTTDTLADGSTRTLEGVSPGMEVAGLPGEELSMNSPNVPNPEFVPYMKHILTLIGINLGLPLVLVLLDAKETNFSGWRGAVDQARLGFRRNQKRLIRRFHGPVYRWKVRQWLADDAVLRKAAARGGIDVLGHRWNPPRWPYIEPLKDASADLLNLRNALISRRRWASDRGFESWGDLSTEIVEDNALIIVKAHEKAEELNKKYKGLNVTWREIACLPTPDGLNLTVGTDQPQNRSQQENQSDAA